MKRLSIVFTLMAFVLIPVLVSAQTGQTPAIKPPVSQPLVREGTLAARMADVLKVGKSANETEAESMLSAAGIAPLNGWNADYPMTPDIVAELQAAISKAADSGKIAMGKDAALKSFQDIMTGYDLAVRPAASDQIPAGATAQQYVAPEALDEFYDSEGPPVVTYYAPPPDYYYLYSYVPYPFWWWGCWFPGFFVLADFDFYGHGHFHHGHEGEHFTNHFRDFRTGQMASVDPATRAHGGVFSTRKGLGWTSFSAQRGARAILDRSNQNFGFGMPSRNGTYLSSHGGQGSWGGRTHSSSRPSFGGRPHAGPYMGSRTYGSSRVYYGRQSYVGHYSGGRSYAVLSSGGRGFNFSGASRGSARGGRR